MATSAADLRLELAVIEEDGSGGSGGGGGGGIGGEDGALYWVDVGTSHQSWTVSKSRGDFEELSKHLAKMFPTLHFPPLGLAKAGAKFNKKVSHRWGEP